MKANVGTASMAAAAVGKGGRGAANTGMLAGQTLEQPGQEGKGEGQAREVVVV